MNPSREAATECSPRRQPWVDGQELTSPEGATETKSCWNSGSVSGRRAVYSKSFVAECWQMYEAESFAPLGLALPSLAAPRLTPWGCILGAASRLPARRGNGLVAYFFARLRALATQLCKHSLAPPQHPWYKRLSVESCVASRAFYPNLLALVRHQILNRLNTWNWSRPRGLHSGTRFLEGF